MTTKMAIVGAPPLSKMMALAMTILDPNNADKVWSWKTHFVIDMPECEESRRAWVLRKGETGVTPGKPIRAEVDVVITSVGRWINSSHITFSGTIDNLSVPYTASIKCAGHYDPKSRKGEFWFEETNAL